MTVIYLFLNFPYLWKCKIGITTWGKGRKRVRDVDLSTSGSVFRVWAVPLPFGARALEKDLHRFFAPFHSPFAEGSGRTEWFLTLPVLPLAWLIINLTALLHWSPFWLLVWWVVANY